MLDGARQDWDEEAFRQGVVDIRRAGFGYAAVTGFWASDLCKVTEEEARRILRELGARFPGAASVLFPAGAGSEAEE